MELHIHNTVGIKYQLTNEQANIHLYESVGCLIDHKLNTIQTYSLLLRDGKGNFKVSLDLSHERTMGTIGLSLATTLFQY